MNFLANSILYSKILVVKIKGWSYHQLKWGRQHVEDGCGGRSQIHPGYVKFKVTVVVVQSLSCVWLFGTPGTAACQGSLSFTISLNLIKLMSIESVMPSNHLILSFPLLLLPSIFPYIRVSFNEQALGIRWPKYWSFRFSISPSIEYSELISFRIDWLDLLAVQGTLKSLLQHRSLKASILWCSAFFMVQLTHCSGLPWWCRG